MITTAEEPDPPGQGHRRFYGDYEFVASTPGKRGVYDVRKHGAFIGRIRRVRPLWGTNYTWDGDSPHCRGLDRRYKAALCIDRAPQEGS